MMTYVIKESTQAPSDDFFHQSYLPLILALRQPSNAWKHLFLSGGVRFNDAGMRAIPPRKDDR